MSDIPTYGSIKCLFGGLGDDLESIVEIRDQVNFWEDPENQQSMLSMFQVDVENYLKVKFGLMYHLHLPPGDIDLWPYWEYEMHVEMLADVLKKKAAAEKGQSGDMNQSQMNPQKASSDLMKSASSKMPKMNMPSMRMPKM